LRDKLHIGLSHTNIPSQILILMYLTTQECVRSTGE